VKGFFSVKGLEEYLEKVVKAGQNIDTAAGRAVEAGAQVVFDNMLDRVPVDTGNLKAHLQATGKTELQHDGNLQFIEIGLLDLGAAKAGYAKPGKRSKRKTYPREFLYGVVLEYGKSNMAAQPYIRPAFDNNRSKVRNAEIEVLKASGAI
jgi:HK97 gp10 family phage protein